jgi:3'-phosphoadenosine 5'-phosphosulfate sulfotransferase (PAPS reductase)/FAD synthetase
MREPMLEAADHAAWEAWQRAVRTHALTVVHARRVEAARRVASECLARYPDAAVMWSGGKDSTAMTHLVCVDLGARSQEVYSEKDDLDFPGEREYVEELARGWDLERLRILEPPVSPARWIAEHAAELSAEDDVHSRAAGLSKTCFYDVVEGASRQHHAIFLGLRSEESRHRRLNRAVHGVLYTKRSGQTVCTPLGDWRGIDVYAYLETRGIELLPVYRCVGLMDADEPWRVRKSWWLPGQHSARGKTMWLRHYYPTLYRQLCAWLPDARLRT